VPAAELREAEDQLSPDFRNAVKTAANNIRGYAKLQVPKPFRKALAPGIRLGQIVRPLEAVAAYVPSGRYPLPSTLMMTVIPAQAAGVPNVYVASPRPNIEIYGTASMLDVTNVFQMGGAHAIAAFAFGTKTVPRVDRIVGPGNAYVTAAKKLLAGEVGIDFVAGPTEVVIISADGDPRWIAADMLAQAEHDIDAAAILFTPSRKLASAVAMEVERQMADLPTAKVARKSIDKNSAIIITSSLEQAVEMSNQFAPEHLSIPEMRLLDQVKHAGTVFVGGNSPEAAGDYAAGPSHVLPTNGAARLRGGLSAADFVKVIAVQELNGEALRRLSPVITTLARAEGLEAHARSVEVRLVK
jgi:histidinol dehydrogenase